MTGLKLADGAEPAATAGAVGLDTAGLSRPAYVSTPRTLYVQFEVLEAGVTFKQYLSARRAGYDAAGDFVRLARADLTMPDVTSRDELKSYMESRRDSYDAMAAAELVWKDFQAAVKKQKV